MVDVPLPVWVLVPPAVPVVATDACRALAAAVSERASEFSAVRQPEISVVVAPEGAGVGEPLADAALDEEELDDDEELDEDEELDADGEELDDDG